jgi:hypothetical protein
MISVSRLILFKELDSCLLTLEEIEETPDFPDPLVDRPVPDPS